MKIVSRSASREYNSEKGATLRPKLICENQEAPRGEHDERRRQTSKGKIRNRLRKKERGRTILTRPADSLKSSRTQRNRVCSRMNFVQLLDSAVGEMGMM